jgi:hypothetical protein
MVEGYVVSALYYKTHAFAGATLGVTLPKNQIAISY